jgi:CRISPR-associated protein Cas5t
MPRQHSLFQQLHNYPVGNTRAEHATNTKGNEYNITPARRAFLSNLRACVCLRGNDDLAAQVRDGLAGKREHCYGVPFLGDSNFLPDRIDVLAEPKSCYWWVPVLPEDTPETLMQVARLTIAIDRLNVSHTRSRLFRPLPEPTARVPDNAWVEVNYG